LPFIGGAHRIDRKAAFHPAVPDPYILPVATEDSAMDGLIERFAKVEPGSVSVTGRRPRVVIIGAGFGGLTAAMRLKRTDADVMVVDRRNYHLFQPLLYQVATAALSPADIAAPIRGILARHANAKVVLGAVAASMWRLAWC
jgi:NADPH-dependent 2,4-dienoyl-CoA reductase/sulfur reductase-like enzyme